MATEIYRYSPKTTAMFRFTFFLFYSSIAIYTYNILGNRFRFLTYWNLLIQSAYFGIGFYKVSSGSLLQLTSSSAPPSSSSSLSPTSSSPPSRWSYFVAGIVFPSCFFVFSTFWILYAIDRELVFPKSLDAIIPPWLNHSKHTIILPSLLLDMYLVRVQYPHFAQGTKVSALFALSYLTTISVVYWNTGSWVYPILNKLAWPGKSLFMASCFVTFFPLYTLGQSVNHLFWGSGLKEENTKE